METNEPITYYTSGEVLWLKQTFFSIDMILSVHFKGIYLTLVGGLHSQMEPLILFPFAEQNNCFIIFNASSSKNLIKSLLEKDNEHQGSTATSHFL